MVPSSSGRSSPPTGRPASSTLRTASPPVAVSMPQAASRADRQRCQGGDQPSGADGGGAHVRGKVSDCRAGCPFLPAAGPGSIGSPAMAKLCEEEICVVTGAGNGIQAGARQAARRPRRQVVVNDLGGAMDGTGSSEGPRPCRRRRDRRRRRRCRRQHRRHLRLGRCQAADRPGDRGLRGPGRAGEQRRDPARPDAGEHGGGR